MNFVRKHCLKWTLLLPTLFAINSWAKPVDSNSETPSLGEQLQQSFVWIQDSSSTKESLHAGFRRTFQLKSPPASARLHLFAYTRYRLYVNGEYVGRGPNRFESIHPEYDSWDIAARLHPGTNVIAVVVHRDWPGDSTANMGQTLSRFRRHEPGFTARLEMADASGAWPALVTDSSWRGFVEAGNILPVPHNYSSIAENYDARNLPGDWTAANFDESALPFAKCLDTSDHGVWPDLFPRSIPHLRERELVLNNPVAANGIVLTNGQTQIFNLPQIEQAYWVADLDAEAETKIVATPQLPESHHGPASTYTCRAGAQRWMSGDTFAQNALSLRVESGRVTLKNLRLVAVNYPFDRVGAFASSDPLLDRVWQLTARSTELLSEDAYTDCADRERSEWMDCDPPMYDATRVMMAGPAIHGAPAWSDPRLYANMLRRVAYSQEQDGMVRARTCSEMVDIHTRMEDRACDWVEGLRKYYEATDDQELIRELWPFCERQLNWFLERRQPDGLVLCREWIAWDNPMSYATCEGAANNAFIWRAFRDAGWLAGQIGNEKSAQIWNDAAEKLQADFNKFLWDETAGAYCSAAGTPVILPPSKKVLKLKPLNGRTEPTLHANLFALDQGIVPPERRARVIDWTLQHADQIRQVMANHYYFNLLASLDRPEYDQIMLDRIRKGWQCMVDSPWQTTWEIMGDGKTPPRGSRCHCYGIVPGYTLSTYVLGVRRDAPVWKHELVIEPHLGDLTHAEGVVVTEFGPAAVAWKIENGFLNFKITVPKNTEAALKLPCQAGATSVLLDGKTGAGKPDGQRCVFRIGPDDHVGSCKSPPLKSN
jgi:alpha-L-rhamnosidase